MKFSVSKEKEDNLMRRLKALNIHESDLDEQFVKSQGAGGQNVNKTATCVILAHRPTGLQVKCQKERSQALNRFFARRLLAEKMEKHLYGIRLAEELERHRIRKQKKRRSRRAKMKIREHKEQRHEKKEMRQPIKETL